MLAVGVLCLGLGTGGAIALAQSGTSTSVVTVTSSTQVAAPSSRPLAQRVDADQGAAFAVLRKAAAASGEVPISATGPSGVAIGANPALARAAVAADGTKAYLVPGSGGLCLADAFQQSCTDTAQAAAGFLLSVELCGPALAAGHNRVVGVVPDGVTTVSLSTPSGATKVAVRDNVYAFDGTEQPLAVSWDKTTIPLGTPGGVSTCAAAG